MKILVADDDEITIATIQKILENAGHQVITTIDGSQVFALIKVEKPHILIIDILMPKVDGIENILLVHKSFPDLPIIAISSSPRYLLSLAKLGATLSIVKPILAGKLIDMVNQFIPQSD